MAQGMTRRGLPATLAAAGAAVLAACSGRRDDRLATEEHEVVAPSGAFTAIVVADGEELRPTIRDTSGEPVWTDDLPHVERYFPGVVWESGADVLWVLSTDHGDSSVRQDGAGAWARAMGGDGMPEDIAELAR